MQRRFAAIALSVAIGLGCNGEAQAQSVSKDPTHAPNGTYRLEAAHSQLLFSIAHLGLTDYYGRFDRIAGSLNFDANEPEKSAVDITISTDSIDTPSQRLNDILKSSDVFSTDQFPAATFKSVSVVRTGPDTGRIVGDLTIKSITKRVTLDVTFTGDEPDPLDDNYALGFRATASVKRSDFGLTGMVWEPLVGDDVQLIIEAIFEHEKE